MRAGLVPPHRSEIAAGTRETFRMWSRCSFSVTSKLAIAPSAPRATTTETSRSNGDEAFEDRGRPPIARQAAAGSAPLRMIRLALAVIAEAAGLQDRRPADPIGAGRDRIRRIDRRRIGRDGDAELGDELLLDQAVLRDRQHARIGQHRLARRQKRRGLRRHVLEFIGDDVDDRRRKRSSASRRHRRRWSRLRPRRRPGIRARRDRYGS